MAVLSARASGCGVPGTVLEIKRISGMDRPDLSALERLDEPAELSELRVDVDALLPDRVAFSEILLEVCHWTDFADAFTHLSEGRARVEDLHVSVCAVLLAEAWNISLADVAHPGVPALTYARLSWVSQNYVRAETIAAANELLLKVHARIPLVEALGERLSDLLCVRPRWLGLGVSRGVGLRSGS